MDDVQLQELIDGYENVIKDLSNNLNTIRADHEDLKRKVSDIIKENYNLNEKIKDSGVNKCDNNDLADNLREQINLVLEEKDAIKELWEKAVKSAESLEQELKIYKSDNLEVIPKQIYHQFKQTSDDKIHKLTNQIKTLHLSIESKNEEIKTINQTKENDMKYIKKLETKIDNLKKKTTEIEDANDDLKKNVHEKERVIQTITLQNTEYREKVNEAIQLVQAALNEKDAALLREANIKSDINKLNNELDAIVDEIKNKFNAELSINKSKYNELKIEYDKLKEEMKCKVLEIEKYQTKSIILQNEIDKFLSGGLNVEESQTSKLLILEKNLETTFQKLLLSEKQNIQIKSDYESMKNDLEQMGFHYERILKSKEVERTSLQNTISQLQSYHKDKELQIKGLNNEIERLRMELKASEKEYQKYIENLQDNLDKEIKSGTEKRKELTNIIEATERLNKKVIQETKDIFTKTDALVRTLKTDNRMLKKNNKYLQETVEEHKKKIAQFKEMITLFNIDAIKINNSCHEIT